MFFRTMSCTSSSLHMNFPRFSDLDLSRIWSHRTSISSLRCFTGSMEWNCFCIVLCFLHVLWSSLFFGLQIIWDVHMKMHSLRGCYCDQQRSNGLLSFTSKVGLGSLCFPPWKWSQLTIILQVPIIHILCPMENFNPCLIHMMNLSKPTLQRFDQGKLS